MHLARRAFLLVFLSAVLGICAIWAQDTALEGLWRIPLALLLAGLALESLDVRRLRLRAHLETAARAFLGRGQPAALLIANPSARPVRIEYAPAVPPGFEPLGAARTVSAPAHGAARDAFTLIPVRLGPQPWPKLPARVLGRLGLAWWSSALEPAARLGVAPDTLRRVSGPRGFATGSRARRVAGAGAELHQLRAYVRGDPLSRIDWKATARSRTLVTREFSEDQHLDILVAVDAGRFSRVRAGRLDRFGVYANLAARFAEVATRNDDRIGLVVYADRVLAECPPARGLDGTMRVRRTLERLTVRAAESDPSAAAIRIRGLLRHRSLIVLLTDLDDASIAGQLTRAVRLLAPPHLVVVAGARAGDIEALTRRAAHGWQDPWVALAAAEHETHAALRRALLVRLGAPVVAAPAELLESAVFAEYEALRRARRV